MAFNPKPRKFLVIFLILGWLVTLTYKYYSNQSAQKGEQIYSNQRILMGTFWKVLSPDKRASEIVFKEIGRLDQLLSKYSKTSEIYMLNQNGKLKVSPDTFYIIRKSKEFWKISEGAFDISVAPLVDLWGFSNQETKIPTDEQIRATLKLVGSDKIILQENNSVVEFILPGMKVDLGAIAKGFAIDCAVKKLKEAKINSCLIYAGGQIYALGEKFSIPWRIAIKNPRQPGILETLELKNQSASTSGDYEQFFLKNKKRFCHIINPKTGYTSDAQVSSVTVIADEGLTADALSTSIFVLGKTKGEKLLNKFPKTKTIIY